MRYFKVFLIQCSDVFQQRARSFVFFLLALILPVVTLLFWQGAYKNQNVIGGWTASEMQSYYLLSIIAGNFLMVHIENWVAYHEIKEGEIASKLLQPIRFLWLMLAYESPWRIIQGLFGIATFLVFVLFGVKPTITTHLDVLALGFIIWTSALILCYLLKMCVALLAFWFTDINAMLETQEVFIVIFAGLIMPVDLLPWNMLTISLFTPYPHIIYYPVLALIGKLSMQNMLEVILAQWLWIGLLYLLYNLLWKRGVYKFSGVGQ